MKNFLKDEKIKKSKTLPQLSIMFERHCPFQITNFSLGLAKNS
jgi:hypothetical protein